MQTLIKILENYKKFGKIFQIFTWYYTNLIKLLEILFVETV